MWKNCVYLKIGDRVKLSPNASKYKCLNSTVPLYKTDNINFNDIYVIGDVTPVLKVSGGDQQFVSLENGYLTYACWCFDKV